MLNNLITKIEKIISGDLKNLLFLVQKLIFGNVITLLFSFLISVILARSLGAYGRGIVAWITSLITVASVLAQFGMSAINKRFVAEDNSKAGDLALFTILIISVISVIIMPLFYYYGINQEAGKNNQMIIIIGLLIIPIMAIANCLTEIFVGLNQINHFNLSLILSKLFNAILVILMVLTKIINPLTAMIALFLALILQIVLTIFLLRKNVKLHLKLSKIKWIFTHLKSHIFSNYVANIFLIIVSSIPVIILTAKSSVKDAGIFSVAMNFVTVIIAFFYSIGKSAVATLPTIKDQKRSNQLKIHITIISFLLVVAAAIFLYLASFLLVSLIFGSGFLEAIIVLKILSIGLIFFVLFNNMQNIIICESKGWLIVISPFIMTLTIYIASLILIPLYGAIGSAMAWNLSAFIAMLASSFIVFKSKK